MKAVMIEESTHNLFIGEASEPIMGEDDLLLDVKATALNRADLLQREGKYPPPPGASSIMGLEMAGVVVKVGSNVLGWEEGDRVCALLPGGGYAQKVVIPAGMAMAIPDHLSFEDAAAIPEVYLTAYLNLFVLGHLSAGDHVLIHAAASGVGTAAIQLAREAGAIPIATAGSQRKLDICEALGAKCLINYKEEDFSERVMTFTNNRGVNVILDPIGASYWEQNDRCISLDGRWLIIGGMGGAQIEQFNILSFMRRRVQLIFSTLRSRSQENKIQLTEQFMHFAEKKWIEGKLKPVVDRIYHWSEVAEAHDYMRQNKNIGKIVLSVQEE